MIWTNMMIFGLISGVLAPSSKILIYFRARTGWVHRRREIYRHGFLRASLPDVRNSITSDRLFFNFSEPSWRFNYHLWSKCAYTTGSKMCIRKYQLWLVKSLLGRTRQDSPIGWQWFESMYGCWKWQRNCIQELWSK